MKQLLLLHGAIGSKEQLAPLSDVLKEDFEVHSINFAGHGGEEMPDVFSIAAFAEQVHQWRIKNKFETISIFGYSMGGYVATYLTKHHPQTIENIITLGTKWHWDEAIAAKESAMLDADAMELKVPRFAAALAKLHQPSNWKTVLQKTCDMLKEMGSSNPLAKYDYPSISSNMLLLIGDRDKMVTLEETVTTYKALPSAQLGVLPNTPHQFEGVDVEVLAFHIRKFLKIY